MIVGRRVRGSRRRVPESGEFLVREEKGTACLVTGLASMDRTGDERRQSRARESSQGSGHLPEPFAGFAFSSWFGIHNQPQLRLEQMATEFVSGGLQVFFALMHSAGGCLQCCVIGLRTPAGTNADDQGQPPHGTPPPRPCDPPREMPGQPMMPTEEISLQ